MKNLFLDIQTKLNTDLSGSYPEIFIRMFNGQFDDIDQGEDGSKIYAFPMPAIFIEFVTDEIQQMGGGYQIYDPMIIRIHYAYQEWDAQDGTMDQNLNVFDFIKLGYKSLQKFNPTGCNHWVRVGPAQQDKNHSNVYHYIEDYRTNYIDSDTAEPVNGIESTPPTDLDLTVQYSQQPQTRTIQ